MSRSLVASSIALTLTLAACTDRRVAPTDASAPSRTVVLGSDSASPFLADGWYTAEGDHRWLGKRGTVMLAGPATAGQQIHLTGYCPAAEVATGSLTGKVSVDGQPVGELTLAKGDAPFDVALPLPAATVGKPRISVTIELDRTFRPAGDVRDLGLSFSTIEIR